MSATDSFTFTVGKLDAGMAILLGERAHLIEFPSILLPVGATTGSIVSIAVHQNHTEEKRRETEFWDLQQQILDEFGVSEPKSPELKLRNVTQTSVTLEWPILELATSKLRSLDIYRDGQRLAAIPSPNTNTSTKLSGLKIEQEYSFQLVLRTTAGTYPSNVIQVKTHALADTSGISVCFGNVEDTLLLENAKTALKDMKAKWSDKIQIDTTHFVCTTPANTPSAAAAAAAAGNPSNAPGVEYQRALQLSIPVVQPHWILACHSNKTMVPIANYYLGTSPPTPTSSQRPQSLSQAPPQASSQPQDSPSQPTGSQRASMPPPSRQSAGSPATAVSAFVNDAPTLEPTPEEDPAAAAVGESAEEDQDVPPRPSSATRRRSGTMNKAFKFPSPVNTSPPPVPGLTTAAESINIEMPPPPPVEKEKSHSGSVSDVDVDEDVGQMEQISLN